LTARREAALAGTARREAALAGTARREAALAGTARREAALAGRARREAALAGRCRVFRGAAWWHRDPAGRTAEVQPASRRGTAVSAAVEEPTVHPAGACPRAAGRRAAYPTAMALAGGPAKTATSTQARPHRVRQAAGQLAERAHRRACRDPRPRVGAPASHARDGPQGAARGPQGTARGLPGTARGPLGAARGQPTPSPGRRATGLTVQMHAAPYERAQATVHRAAAPRTRRAHDRQTRTDRHRTRRAPGSDQEARLPAMTPRTAPPA
jgi:hypothetical protein